jgi:Acyl-CoA dehydrogenase, middle domain
LHGDGRIVVEANMGAISAVMAYGTAEQRKLAAELVLSGDKPAICITEPDAGSDARSMTTMADRRGDGYVINGKKHWITGAGVSRLHLILARTFDEAGEELGTPWRRLKSTPYSVHRADLSNPEPEPESDQDRTSIEDPSAAMAPIRNRLAVRTGERYADVQVLVAGGRSLSAIGQVLSLDRRTVRRFARASAAERQWAAGSRTHRDSHRGCGLAARQPRAPDLRDRPKPLGRRRAGRGRWRTGHRHRFVVRAGPPRAQRPLAGAILPSSVADQPPCSLLRCI